MILIRELQGYGRHGRTGKSLVLKTEHGLKRYCGIFSHYGELILLYPL